MDGKRKSKDSILSVQFDDDEMSYMLHEFIFSVYSIYSVLVYQ